MTFTYLHELMQLCNPHFHSENFVNKKEVESSSTLKSKEIRITLIPEQRTIDMQRNRSNTSINSVSDSESNGSQFESFHSYDSPPLSLPSKLSPLQGDDVARERKWRGDDHEEMGDQRSSTRGDMAMVEKRNPTKTGMVKMVEFGCRVLGVVFCLVSFSIMVSDKTKGWTGDSFYRYPEYRYCSAINAFGLIYSGVQTCCLTIGLNGGKHSGYNRRRYRFNFAMDQIIAYLLVSASSSGITRVDDWVSNWGEDEFSKLAGASIVMSFLAFAAFSISSLVSGYHLFM